MIDILFTQYIADKLYNSKEQFPVDLDEAWSWLQYSKKDKALDNLKANFDIDDEYCFISLSTGNGGGARNTQHKYYMTVDTFKQMGMMSNKAIGKTIRQYFLNCERNLKELVKDSDHYIKMSRLQLQAQQALKELKQSDEVFYNSCIQSLGLIDKVFADDRLLIEKQRTELQKDKLNRFLERCKYLVDWIKSDIEDFSIKDSNDKFNQRYKDLILELSKIEKLLEPYNLKQIDSRKLPFKF